jgi:hypothetical protein
MRLVTLAAMIPLTAIAAACSSAPVERVSAASAPLEGEEHGSHGHCGGVDDELVEHACLHGSFGPFRSVTAAALGESGPDVSRAHTAFAITLPEADGGRAGAVRYRPTEDGDFAFFSSTQVAVTVRDAQGGEVEAEVAKAVSGCDSLSAVTVHGLRAGEVYTLEFGPTSETVITLVVEHIEPAECPVCETHTLTASKRLPFGAYRDAVETFENPFHFEIPKAIDVVEGDSGPFTALLDFRDEDGTAVRCIYRGNAPLWSRAGIRGTAYEFVRCSNGANAGDEAHATTARLRVNYGNPFRGHVIRASVTLESPSCHDDHGHDDHGHDDDHDHDH